ncbi:MAG: isoprenylcysteine carboxylmethyltransferase family protein [Betaproteobacteria bacterium]|nr:isoprenylcysteine carboxylmethyltransferase family protein [Betaproteobacteria bacterium]MCC6850861.1 isoprenylcysteine carboxylmethyltransferase family protein [Rubrivivax sp.]
MLDLRIPPLLLWAVFAAAIAAAAHWLPALNVPFSGQRVLAVALGVAGIAVALAGVVAFKRAKTTVNPLAPERARQVVATGVYRFTRNPMYLGLAATLLGLAVWWASLAGLVLVAVFSGWMTRGQIRREEAALLARFGDGYADYMARVRRWL